MSNEYTCAKCGETYGKGWTDEEASTEFAADFPGEPIEDAVLVCDDCHRVLVEAVPPPGRNSSYDFWSMVARHEQALDEVLDPRATFPAVARALQNNEED